MRKGTVPERGQYQNTVQDADKTAKHMIKKYGKCRAACETTGNMWRKTYDALDSARIDVKLATCHMTIIAKTGKKTDKVDAEKTAQILGMDMIPECHVPDLNIRGNTYNDQAACQDGPGQNPGDKQDTVCLTGMM